MEFVSSLSQPNVRRLEHGRKTRIAEWDDGPGRVRPARFGRQATVSSISSAWRAASRETDGGYPRLARNEKSFR